MNLENKFVSVFDKGIKAVKPVSFIPSQPSKRGIIRGFSSHSVNRLRDFILKHSVSDSQIFGLTVTCPFDLTMFDDPTGLGIENDLMMNFYRESFNRFTGFLRYHFPDSGFVFRHELQVRKVPHFHCVCFYRGSDKVSPSLFVDYWLKSIQYKASDLIGAFKHSVRVDKISPDNLSLFRYLVDHTSKSKQAQLGYIGKQWGVIGRSNFEKCSGVRFEFFSDRESINFHRQISRLIRYTEKSDCVFGSRRLSRYKMRSVIFVSRSVVEQVYKMFHVEHIETICPIRKLFLSRKNLKKITFPPCILNQYMI